MAGLFCMYPAAEKSRMDWAEAPLPTVSAGFLAVQLLFSWIATDGFDGIAWNLCMAGAVLLMFCYIRICTGNER